jgi:hypothetical protein
VLLGNLHSVEWLLCSARQPLFLREGRLSSKSEAADRGALNAFGPWRDDLPRAKRIRLNPELAACADVRRWLRGLEQASIQAVDTHERELRAAMDLP